MENTCPVTPPRVPSPKPPDTGGGTTTPKMERESPEPNCAICLGKTENKSFTDSCLHQFCFNCLLEWSKVKAECPLCKQSFKSIIHNVRSNEDYDQYHLHPHGQHPTFWSNVDSSMVRFRYRTTRTGDRQHERFEPVIPFFLSTDAIPSQRTNRRRPRMLASDFRAQIYRDNLWVNPLPDITGRHRESSPEFYRANPAQVHRLVPWLNRELNILRVQSSHLVVIMDLILQMLQRYPINSVEFHNQLAPHMGSQTSHFVHEFYAFATSPYDMIGFDEAAVYEQQRYSYELQPVDSDSDSDSVIVLSPQPSTSHSLAPLSRPADNLQSISIDMTLRTLTSNLSPIPGPSGFGGNDFSLLDHVLHAHTYPEESTRTSVSQESTTPRDENTAENDSDDCIIVGYVKPRHERTPEIITLDSEPEVLDDPVSLEDFSESLFSSSSSLTSDSEDSDFVPYQQTKRTPKKKETRKVSRKAPRSDYSPPPKRKQQTCSSESASPSTSHHRSRRKKSKRNTKHKRDSSVDSSEEEREARERMKKSRKSRKEQWRIVQKTDSEMEHDYSHDYFDPPYTEEEVMSFASESRPKLRSIIITKSGGSSQQREHSHSSSVASSSRSSSHYHESRHHKHKYHRREEKKRKEKRRSRSSSGDRTRAKGKRGKYRRVCVSSSSDSSS